MASATGGRWLDWCQVLIVVISAPFFLFPSLKYAWIFTLVPLLWVARRLMMGEFFEKTALDWSLGILAIQVFATCLIVPDIVFSLPKIAGVLYGVLFFYTLVGLLKSERLTKWGLFAFLGGGIVLAVVGQLGMMWSSETFFYKTIVELTKKIPKIRWKLPGAEQGINPNPLAGTLLLFIPLIFTLLFPYFRGKNNGRFIKNRTLSMVLFLAALAVMSFVLFSTQSVGSWVALGAALWLVLLGANGKKWSVLLAAMSAGFLFSFGVLDVSIVKERLPVEFLKAKIEQRVSFWQAGLKTIDQHPFFGIGMNRLRLDPSIGYVKAHAHNHFIHVAAELGIPALVAYLAVLIGGGWMCFRVARTSGGWMRAAARGLVTGQLAHLIFGLGDSIPLGAKTGVIFWISLALITAMYNYVTRNKRSLEAGKIP